MKLVVLFASFLFLLTPVAGAADDPVAKAMKLYEKRHYAEAETALHSQLSAVEPGRKSAAQLTLGMIYLRNADLHRALYQESLVLHQDYLQKLAAAKGKGRSVYADLYLGETLLEAGKLDPALSHLERFIAAGGVDDRSLGQAKASLGLYYFLKNNGAKAREIWAETEKDDPEIKAALASVYSKARLADKQPAALADESAAAVRKSGNALSARHVKNLVSVYAAAGLVDKGLDLVHKADLKAYSYRETLSKTKIVSFYDISLLNGLSQLYLKAALTALEKAAEDAKVRDTANFYLGEAHTLAGNIDQSLKVTGSFISSQSMPPQYRDRATARQAANQYQKGRQLDAIGVWDDLSRKQPGDPDVLAEILFACSRLRIDCPSVAGKAAAAAEAGEGKRYANLNAALGSYFHSRKEYGKAVSYLETGRDKSNKNKIESNDPAMFVSLADAYYRTKKFSEALEIYFEMSKQFPQIRQIQEALQGIYAMEHKSAGDVKIN